ncbi:MAG: sensor histidine kinase [Brevinematia bacterium]
MDENLSQIVRYTIEKIDKLPSSTVVSLFEKLLEERERFLSILNSYIGLGILIIDAEFKVIFYNTTILKYYLIKKDGNKIVFNERFESFLKDIITKVSLDKISRYSVDFVLNGESIIGVLGERFFLVSFFTEDFREFFVVVNDKTEESLKDIDKKQSDSMIYISNIISGIAHEIKNPLSALYIHASIIKKLFNQKKLDMKNLNREIDIIISEIDRLNSLVSDFIQYFRPFKLVEKYENVNDIVREVFELFMPELRQKNIEFEILLDENLPKILCDRNILKQSIINLVKNAIDSVREGEGKIIISTSLVSKFSDTYVVISVKDNGVGIPDEVKHKVFEPFFTTKPNGTGLGLSIVYNIVKLHRGFIDFSSKEGEGSEFRIYLPIIPYSKELEFKK